MSDQSDTVHDFGRELINARRYKGITLEQISEITKVDVHYLKAMEEGEWDILPRPYMEAFLKAYAEAVGMHVPRVMKKYREMVYLVRHPQPPAESAAETVETTDQAEPDLKKPQGDFVESPARKRPLIYLLGIAVIIVSVVSAMLIFRSDTEEPSSSNVTDRPPGTAGRAKTRTGDQTKPTLDSLRAQMATRDTTQTSTVVRKRVPTEMTIEMLATRSCWLRATVDKGSVKDVLLEPGQSLTLKAQQEIFLVAGNAGGLELIFNGDSLGVLGPLDKPVTVVIGPDGIKSQRLGVQNPEDEAGSKPRRRRP